jgi:DNA ligase (NAD+)
VRNLLDSIEKSKQQSLARLIYGLGIRHVGKYAAQLLATHYNSLDELAKTSLEELKEIHGLGEKTAEAIATFFATEENIALIEKLKGIGVKTQEEQKPEDLPLKGNKFVFTGSLQTLSRPDASELVKTKGGLVTSSVSKTLDYVVVGENPGSKYKKAKKLGITILNEEEFKDLVKS